MAINTTLSITLTKQFMLDLGFSVDEQSVIRAAPKGIWASAIWFANNDTDKGYLQLIDNGAALNPTPVLDSESKVTGFKFNIPAFTQDVLKGGVMYIALASDSSLVADPFANLTEGLINNLQRAQTDNFTFGTFEFTLQGGAYDAGDLTAISTFGFPMSATAIVDGAAVGSVGFKVKGSEIWSEISALGTVKPLADPPVNAPAVYAFDAAKGPLTSDAFAVTPTTAVGGSFKPPEGKSLPFSSTDWDKYLDKLASVDGVIAQVGGTFNGAAAPVKNWVSTTVNQVTKSVNDPINVWHNAGFFDYEVSYKSALSVQVDGKQETIGAFLLSPTAASQVKGYIVIPKGDEPGLAKGWEGGLANSIYSTLGMAQVYAQDPSIVSGQTPYLFQHATIDNNGSALNPANTEFFNVGANTQWGKVFTQLLTGFAAGYVGSTGTALNPLQTDGTVDLSKSWNWDPTYAFAQNLATTPYGTDPSFQFTDNYAKIFFQNSNVYGDMYSDNLMSLYTTGSPLLPLSKPAGGGNVDEVNVTVFSTSDTPTGYVSPTINNYPWAIGTQPTLVAPSTNEGVFTLNFTNPAGADGQQSFVADASRMTLAVKVWDPTLNDGKGAFSNSAELPAFPVAQVTVSGIVGQEVPQGAVLTTTDAQQRAVTWTVVSNNNFIIPAEGTPLNGSVTVSVTANLPSASISSDATWNDLALAFPLAVAAANSSASVAGQSAQDPEQVTIRFSGDGGANFESGYIVDSANNRWSFSGGTINGTTGFVDVLATASASGISVGASEAWQGIFQESTVTTKAASVPGVFWSDYAATYADGVLSFANQNVTTQPTGILQLTELPLGQSNGDFVWYQLEVKDTESNFAKTFNFYPQNGVNTANSQYIDGGAAITLGAITNRYTINFAGSGVDPLPSSLFIPDQTHGNIPLQGTPYAPVIGTQTETYYQYLGQSVNFTTATTSAGAQPTAGSHTMSGLAASSYIFGWTGLNPAAIDDGSISKWTNKANGLDIVQINITDTLDASRNTKVFAQADLDGQWLTGLSSIINPIGADLQLISKPVSLVAGRTYQITSQEFAPTDSGLDALQPSGVAPIGNISEVLTVVVAGTSGMLETEDNELNDFVYSLYDGILDRVPDQAGFFYWANEVASSENGRTSVLSNVMLSEEFQASWSNLSDEQLVKTAYAFILNRAPDAQGEAYWLAELKTGQFSQQQLLQSFIDSSESAQITDSITQNGYLAMF
ncbi:DUF4214 domain-containing protein [Zwartia sp.]|uniref:DUF4214 domain-containing protein n=1 Tax=Zwartia sp. TaxID=2978004 RepID=UPI00272652EE|nr:DUF4214 domain-containing protein [Zwartia sp.]MDO9025173.1 DUF4214 domain-containing protein [Zwartia sp.]